MMEQLAFRLGDLNGADKTNLATQLERLSFEYSEKKECSFRSRVARGARFNLAS